MRTALYYHPEAYTISGPRLMGRNAAGESFLRGFLAHSRADEFWVQVQQAGHAREFARSVQAAGRDEPVRAVDARGLAGLRQAGLVYHPGPGLGEHAFQRAAHGHGAWSLCGITHTTSSDRAMDAIVALTTAPVQPWDALICTSAAVKANVIHLLEAQKAYLEERLGIRRLVLPQLPVIPLGIHCSDFAFDESQRAAARERLGVDADTVVVLFMGRLSFHAKAHPLAMYQALERAAQAGRRKVVLVECGWHANDFIARAFADAAAQACPGVRVVTLEGRQAEDRRTAWAGADIFCSLSDNIQETFGITPVEAMASGLPVVVSDWDGYKDTVRDGIDGLRIPTVMPPPGTGGDLALRHALEIDSYDLYCGHACSFVAVDVDATARAFEQLFASPELRRRMGEAGRQRAREVFDWAAIIPRYEALWQQLADIRRAEAPKLKPLPAPWPARPDPFSAFAGYPTRTLLPQTRLRLAEADAQAAAARLARYRALAVMSFAAAVLPDEAECRAVLDQLARGAQPAQELVAALAPERQLLVFRALAWMLKTGVLALDDAAAG